MVTHGSIGEFQHTQEPWQSYVERLQQYFVANDVDAAEKQRAILLSIVGGKTYQLIRNLLGPSPQKGVLTKLWKLYGTTTSLCHQSSSSDLTSTLGRANRARMSQRMCRKLRKLSEYCNFGDTLEDMLRDRLVSTRWKQSQ